MKASVKIGLKVCLIHEINSIKVSKVIGMK